MGTKDDGNYKAAQLCRVLAWVPVSYTHLDVYKRQIPYNPVRLCQESKAEEYKAAPLRLGQLQRYLNAAEQLGVLPLIYTCLLYTSRCV